MLVRSKRRLGSGQWHWDSEAVESMICRLDLLQRSLGFDDIPLLKRSQIKDDWNIPAEGYLLR